MAHNSSTADTHFMRRALALAATTDALASPNPQVGCVLVRKSPHPGREGHVIGEGAHRFADRDHAEIAALKQAKTRGLSTVGATAYVTLEPCSHHGRTGPCADALIAARVARVVIATLDPNPVVRGQGIARLRAAGIEVTVGLLEQPARTLNNAFAFAIQHQRPFVTLKSALSADGKLAPPPAARVPNRPFLLTGPAARADVQQLRHASDALLTGIGTVLADDPALSDRTGLPRRRPLLRVVLDTNLRTPLDSQLVRTAERDVLLLCAASASTARIDALEAHGVEIAMLPQHAGRLSLAAALDVLWERQCTRVLLETGSELNGAFLAQHLVDRLVLYRTDTTLGPAGLPFAKGLPSPDVLTPQLTHLTRDQLGPDHVLTGLLHDPWSTTPPDLPFAGNPPAHTGPSVDPPT